MVEEKLQYYKELLLKEKEDVLSEIMDSDESVKNIIEDDLHNVNDSIDIASYTVTQNILMAMNKNSQQKIMAIDAALRRIIENAYGICVNCGDEISENRLTAVPWTTQCIKCKNEAEKKH